VRNWGFYGKITGTYGNIHEHPLETEVYSWEIHRNGGCSKPSSWLPEGTVIEVDPVIFGVSVFFLQKSIEKVVRVLLGGRCCKVLPLCGKLLMYGVRWGVPFSFTGPEVRGAWRLKPFSTASIDCTMTVPWFAIISPWTSNRVKLIPFHR
jgi:hypothetical protein